MKDLLPILIALSLVGCKPSALMTSQGRYDKAINELTAATSDEAQFYALGDAAKEAFVLGKKNEAKKHAIELERLSPKFQKNWNYGNAIQDYNLVLGRLAVADGDLENAEAYLLAAGRSPGSPQMDTFGPNLSLAKDLVEQGRREVVIEYLELCRSFWEMDRGRLDQWAEEVRGGKTPDFGANLVY